MIMNGMLSEYEKKNQQQQIQAIQFANELEVCKQLFGIFSLHKNRGKYMPMASINNWRTAKKNDYEINRVRSAFESRQKPLKSKKKYYFLFNEKTKAQQNPSFLFIHDIRMIVDRHCVGSRWCRATLSAFLF